jgi:hypothetical protein
VGEVIGETAIKTKKVLDSATPGMLFVDEAYRLTHESNSTRSLDYGRESVETIMRALNDRPDLTVLFAGYVEPMKHFLRSNQGLRRRIGMTLMLDSYEVDDIAKILELKLQTAELAPYLMPSTAITHEAVVDTIHRYTSSTFRTTRNGSVADILLRKAMAALDRRLLKALEAEGQPLLDVQRRGRG